MAIGENFTFLDGPIPGMSLTSAPGDRPWENPPAMVTIEEAIDFYTNNILINEEVHDDVLNALETGIPVRNFANMLIKNAVMEGKHTLDVGFLIQPVIEELLMAVCDTYGVEYVTSVEDKLKESTVPARQVRLAFQDFKQSLMKETNPEEMSMLTEAGTPSATARGLMARPQKEEE